MWITSTKVEKYFVDKAKLPHPFLCIGFPHWVAPWKYLFWFQKSTTYRVCQGFRLTKSGDYFWVTFDHFWSKAAGALAKIGSSLKQNHYNQVKLDQIPDTHCWCLWKSIYIDNRLIRSLLYQPFLITLTEW